MRAHYRSLFYGGCLAAALAASTAGLAIETDESSWELRPLVSETGELVGVARKQTTKLDARLARAASMPYGSTEFTGRTLEAGGWYEYSELKRTATRLAEIGNEVLDKASHCGEESRKVGLAFRTRTRQFLSSVSRIATSASSAFARMAIPKVEKDLDAIERQLQVVASMTSCASKESSDKEQQGDVDKAN